MMKVVAIIYQTSKLTFQKLEQQICTILGVPIVDHTYCVLPSCPEYDLKQSS